MGLIGGMARTAVIAGTATAVSNNVSRRQAQRWNQEADAAAYQAQQGVQSTAQVNTVTEDPTVAQLQQLSQLKNQGIITEEEFQAKKKQILGI